MSVPIILSSPVMEVHLAEGSQPVQHFIDVLDDAWFIVIHVNSGRDVHR